VPAFPSGWEVIMKPTGVIATIRHRLASQSSLEAGCWEYDPSRRIIIARLVLASSEVFDLDVEVTTSRAVVDLDPLDPIAVAKHRLRHILIRQSEDVWMLSATRIGSNPVTEIAKAERFHPRMPIGNLILTHAQATVQKELAALDEA
jgi:hypothetical protein